MTLPNSTPPDRNPRLPLWFWGGLAAGLATLFVIGGLVAAGLIQPRLTQGQPTAAAAPSSSARPVAAVKTEARPTATELPILPPPSPLAPAATAQPSPVPPTATLPPARASATRPATATRTAVPAPTLAPANTPLLVVTAVLQQPGQPTPSPVPLIITQPAEVAPTRGPLVTVGPTATYTPSPTVALQATAGQPSPTLAPSATPQPAMATLAPAATPTPTLLPTSAAPAPPPGAALVEIIPVPANAQDSHAITATIKVITDTAIGPKTLPVALMTSGLPNVPLHVPVKLRARPADAAAPGSGVAWQLTVPVGSQARLTGRDQAENSFTPDVPGYYKIDASLLDAGGQTGRPGSVRVYAGTYVGVAAGRCGACHPRRTQAWGGTGHARILTDEIDNLRTPDVPTHYAETCIRCHTTGYYPGAANGGFADAQAKTGWVFPTFRQIDAAGQKTGPSNWAAMPEPVKNMANIQCEVCHGPAGEHVQQGLRVMASSQAEGVCNQCHNGGGHHLKGTELQNAAHADAAARAWTYPVGPGRQECVRCHSGNGYTSFLANPGNMAAWDNRPQTVVCSTCHDPHSEANTFQLRVTGQPVALPFETRNVGLSATCYECHNARTRPADALDGQYPHYSSAAEFLSDTGGVTYGKTPVNSPHGATVGIAPVPNPAAAQDAEAPRFLFSKAGDDRGNVPGACVACHMWPTIEDQQNPNWHKVGAHSFNMVGPDGKYDFAAPCRSCHGEVGDFNLRSGADYDGNGMVEGAQDEVRGLLILLLRALEDRGVRRLSDYPYLQAPRDAGEGVKNAVYNFRTVYGTMWSANGAGNQGKAQAVHNFKRAVSLLQLSYHDLTGEDVPGAETLVK